MKSYQELYGYLCSFKNDEDPQDDSHPASLVQELLSEGDVALRCQHLNAWYAEYAQLRGMSYLHKPVGQDHWLKKYCYTIMNFMSRALLDEIIYHILFYYIISFIILYYIMIY